MQRGCSLFDSQESTLYNGIKHKKNPNPSLCEGRFGSLSGSDQFLGRVQPRGVGVGRARSLPHSASRAAKLNRPGFTGG